MQNLDLLTDAGIEAEDFGGSTVVVRAVPADVPVDDVEDMIVELAAKLADGGRDALREKTEWVLHSIACRAAIKAGDRTNAAEMLALAQRIMDGTVPPFCPHGRPCVLKSPGRSWKAVWPTCLTPRRRRRRADGQRQDRTFRRAGQSL